MIFLSSFTTTPHIIDFVNVAGDSLFKTATSKTIFEYEIPWLGLGLATQAGVLKSNPFLVVQ